MVRTGEGFEPTCPLEYSSFRVSQCAFLSCKDLLCVPIPNERTIPNRGRHFRKGPFRLSQTARCSFQFDCSCPVHYLAMAQNPGYPPVNIPIPPKLGSKMGGEFTYPKMVPLVLTHSHLLSSMEKNVRYPHWPRSWRLGMFAVPNEWQVKELPLATLGVEERRRSNSMLGNKRLASLL